ncbi:unnamed protein product [Lathyrus oleraceus]
MRWFDGDHFTGGQFLLLNLLWRFVLLCISCFGPLRLAFPLMSCCRLFWYTTWLNYLHFVVVFCVLPFRWYLHCQTRDGLTCET